MPLTFAVERTGHVRGYVSGIVDWLKPEAGSSPKAETFCGLRARKLGPPLSAATTHIDPA
ncbi:hypothetical protein ASF56_01025 [Methylobacterium sp. Leaf122]|nr:hypothetical protein ASF56_01025 [Methylobacterium sp. Leaf122]